MSDTRSSPLLLFLSVFTMFSHGCTQRHKQKNTRHPEKDIFFCKVQACSPNYFKAAFTLRTAALVLLSRTRVHSCIYTRQCSRGKMNLVGLRVVNKHSRRRVVYSARYLMLLRFLERISGPTLSPAFLLVLAVRFRRRDRCVVF